MRRSRLEDLTALRFSSVPPKGVFPCGSGWPAAMIEAESLFPKNKVETRKRLKSRIKM
jgi:hypothetical protein